MRENDRSGINLFYQRFIKGFLIVIFSYLVYISAVSTCYFDPYNVLNVFQDNIAVNVLFLLMTVVVSCIASFLISKINGSNSPLLCQGPKFLKIFSFILLASAGILWVLYSRLWLCGTDDYYCFDAANAMREGDYSTLQDGGYLNEAINNLPFVWIERIMMVFLNGQFILGFQIINAISLPVFYFFLVKLTWSEKYGITEDLFASIVYLMGIAFTPLIYLCSFCYGAMLGLCFATAAIFFEVKFFSSLRSRYLILSLIFITISFLLKQNYSIFAMAMVIYALFKVLADNSGPKISKVYVPIIYIVVLLVVLLNISNVVYSVTEKITGVNLDDKGYNYLSFIAMGTQETEDPNRPGSWTDYNGRTYAECGYSSSAQQPVALDAAKKSLSAVFSSPSSFFSFLERKINYQWNCPEFESDSRITNPFCASHPNATGIESYWTNGRQSGFLNILHMAILFGTLAYLIIFLSLQHDSTVLLLVFLGGFLFHIFWEGKALYALPYFALLMPFAILGYKALGDVITSAIKTRI